MTFEICRFACEKHNFIELHTFLNWWNHMKISFFHNWIPHFLTFHMWAKILTCKNKLMSHVNMWQNVHFYMGVTYAHMQLTFPPTWIIISTCGYLYLIFICQTKSCNLFHCFSETMTIKISILFLYSKLRNEKTNKQENSLSVRHNQTIYVKV